MIFIFFKKQLAGKSENEGLKIKMEIEKKMVVCMASDIQKSNNIQN
jgi:hypothetical protein